MTFNRNAGYIKFFSNTKLGQINAAYPVILLLLLLNRHTYMNNKTFIKNLQRLTFIIILTS